MAHTRSLPTAPYPKGFWEKKAWDFGDNPDIRGGRDRATVHHGEYWEVRYAKKKRKAKKKQRKLRRKKKK